MWIIRHDFNFVIHVHIHTCTVLHLVSYKVEKVIIDTNEEFTIILNSCFVEMLPWTSELTLIMSEPKAKFYYVADARNFTGTNLKDKEKLDIHLPVDPK